MLLNYIQEIALGASVAIGIIGVFALFYNDRFFGKLLGFLLIPLGAFLAIVVIMFFY